MKALGLPFICMAMFAVAGGHWAVLQSVAWGQMLWNYSQQEGSLLAGAQKTFSGEAPCAMCKKIAAAKKQEKKAPATNTMGKKFDATVMAFTRLVPQPASRDFQFPAFKDGFLTRSDEPPVPVPIVAA